MRHRFLLCQHLTCKKQGAAEVLTTLHNLANAEVEVTATGCLGRCGEGPNLLVLPETQHYSQVTPELVSELVRSRQRPRPWGKPLQQMASFQPTLSVSKRLIVGLVVLLSSAIAFLAW